MTLQENTGGYNKDNFSNSSMADFFRILFRQKKMIIVFFMFILAVITAITFLSPEIYRSDASLLVKLGRENVVLDPTVTLGKVTTIKQDRSNEINSEIQILQSQDLMEITVDKLGLKTFMIDGNQTAESLMSWEITSWLKKAKSSISKIINKLIPSSLQSGTSGMNEEREKIIKTLMENFSCQAVRQSNIILLNYEDKDPERAHKVLQELISNYLVKHMAVHRTSGSFQFFDKQVETLREDIQNKGRRLKELKNQTGISSFDQQRELILERIDSLTRNLQDVESSMAASDTKVNVFNRILSELPKTIVQTESSGSPISAVEELKKETYRLEIREQELLSTFSEQSVPVKEIRRQIKAAKELLIKAEKSQEVTTGVNSVYQQLDMQKMLEKGALSAFKAKAGTLKKQITEARNDLKTINNYEMEIKELERDLNINEASYMKYYDSKEDIRIDNALEQGKISNISIAQPATVPVEPVRPQKALNLAIGLFLGVFGGMSLAFFREYMDHTFVTPEDLERRLGLPSLGSVPKLQSGQVNQIEIEKESHFYLPYDSVSSISDTENEIPAKIINEGGAIDVAQRTDSFPRVIAVTSSRAGEGTSTVSIYLASMLRQHFDKQVLLIDANFKNPALHRIMEGNRGPGLGDILNLRQIDTDVIQKTNLPGLHFLSVGTERPAHISLPEKRIFITLLQSLKQKYDFVVLDTPPLWNGSGAKTSRFETLADGVVIVVEAEKIRWEVALKSKERLNRMNTRILGAILNKRKYHIPHWIYKNL